MKQLKLNLFALLVSITIFACKKESVNIPLTSQPVQVSIYKIDFFTANQHGNGLFRVQGTLFVYPTYHIKDYLYADLVQHRDSMPHEMRNDSIFFTQAGINLAGPHFERNDTLFTAIPPGQFYK